MVKSKNTVALTCDICGFKVVNPYIFKRHLHKCYSIHGIASKRSTPRHPIRLKGTEAVRSPDCRALDQAIDTSINMNYENENGISMKIERDNQPAQIPGTSYGDEEEGSIGSVSSQWGVTSSPQVTEKKEDGATREFESPSPSLPARAKFERKYSCDTCPFETLKSKHYLYHLREEHGEKVNIFECHLCDYASRYNNKLVRHMAVHKNPDRAIYSIDPIILSNQRLRVKPLKLKRLSVKTSSEFEVSPAMSPKMSPSTSNDKCSASPSLTVQVSPSTTSKASPTVAIKTEADALSPKPKQRDVFKMALAKDGSSYYQCRFCLFYANTPFNVKKHHALCHSKLLNCPYCKYSTSEQADHYEHILTHDGTGKLSFMKCDDCSYVTHARTNFEKHRSFHGAEAPFHCTVCNFAAVSETKVKRHMVTQHKSQPPDDMKDEMDDEQTMQLEENPGMREDRNVSAIVPDQGGGDTQQDTFIKFRCPQCPMMCLRRGNFTRHLITRHNYTQATASQTGKNIERKLLKKRKLPNASLPVIIPAKKRRPLLFPTENLKCSDCSYTAKWPSDLRRHWQVHTIVKRFKCSMCNNKYKYLGDLNVHMRRDHYTEPQNIAARDFISSEVVKKASPAQYRCPICPYLTYSKADLEQHSKQHKDIEKTFRCRICDYQTYWRGDVGRHLFRHHKILLGKNPQEIEAYFLHRPEIRPITKQPQYNMSIQSSSKGIEPMDGSQDMNTGESSLANPHKNMALFSKREGQFSCNYPSCDFKTTTAEKLEMHIAYHENLKLFMCPTCGKRTNWKWDIVKHLHKVHRDAAACPDDVVTLPVEEARATIGEYLSSIDKKTTGISVYLCSQCDFKSGDKCRVVTHLSINHKDENGQVLTKALSNLNSSGADLKSTDCSFESNDNSNMTNTSIDNLFVDPPLEELSMVEKPFACAVCKKGEVSKNEVKKHYNYAHPYKDIRVIYTVDGTEFDYNTNEIYCKNSDDFQENADQPTPANLKVLKPDSKYSNPKMHGYVKPFKCSICGLRSNWKWDLKKHLRAKHPNLGGFVIMLSIAEAKSTYATECSPSHPKEVNKQPAYKFESELPLSSSEVSPFKYPTKIKGEPYDANYGIFESSKASSRAYVTNFDPNRRQWKCSGCTYITNWRRNMARHIQRHHSPDKTKIRVIALHLLNKEIQQKYFDEQIESMTTVKSRYHDDDQPTTHLAPDDSLISAPGSCRLWKCPKCTFQSNLKTHIIHHMQKHNMKPFMCLVCNSPFMNRGPLHRHIQRIHGRSDYVKLCKVNIDYGDNNVVDSVFVCCLCQLESKDRTVIKNHIHQEHEVKDYEYYIVSMEKKNSEESRPQEISHNVSPEQRGNRTRKFHFCQICPYRSQKKAMLAFHMTYHKPSPVNRMKCKFCPYYVSTLRLLHQHQSKWHSEKNRIENGISAAGWDHNLSSPPTSPLKQSGHGEESISPGGRRHYCQKCPYTTNSKNDFIYHKQFHRPKRTAEFKCEYCDYWVVHKRLLKQHMRLHTEDESSKVDETSPAKSVYSDAGLVYDPVELTELAAIKQQMISAKITPSLSKNPKFSPMKMVTKLSVDNKPGYVLKNGMYRKLHKCTRCPYTNTRARNMQLHEMMHGPRQCSYPLMKCPYCDYYVGSKGLLSHHMKVHSKNYGDTPENDAMMAHSSVTDDDDGSEAEIQTQQKVDTLLSISRFKRFGCEKCPYASAKRQHFQRHLELHGSRQRYTCQYCDYSVPSSYLLTQHSKLHLMPNQNLLASQSINNLMNLSEVPADVALASALPPTDRDMPVTISVIHDHLGLYENSIYDSGPKKLYRCDRCPYANIRRDYLLSHLKFHMVPSSLVCPYCDYSAPKQTLLIQHIRVHFCPLPELSDWLLENGQTERETSQRNIDLAEALKVAHEYQNQSKKKSTAEQPESLPADGNKEKTEEKENVEDSHSQDIASQQTLICQYCDRDFSCSEKLVKHELQHLIGNQFENALKSVSEGQILNVSKKKPPKLFSTMKLMEAKDDIKKETADADTDGDGEKGANGDVVVSLDKEDEYLLPLDLTLDLSGDNSFKLELSMDTDMDVSIDDQDLPKVVETVDLDQRNHFLEMDSSLKHFPQTGNPQYRDKFESVKSMTDNPQEKDKSEIDDPPLDIIQEKAKYETNESEMDGIQEKGKSETDKTNALTSETDKTGALKSKNDKTNALKSETDKTNALKSETDKTNALKSKTENSDALESELDVIQEKGKSVIDVIQDKVESETDVIQDKVESETDVIQDKSESELDVIQEKGKSETDVIQDLSKSETDVIQDTGESEKDIIQDKGESKTDVIQDLSKSETDVIHKKVESEMDVTQDTGESELDVIQEKGKSETDVIQEISNSETNVIQYEGDAETDKSETDVIQEKHKPETHNFQRDESDMDVDVIQKTCKFEMDKLEEKNEMEKNTSKIELEDNFLKVDSEEANPLAGEQLSNLDETAKGEGEKGTACAEDEKKDKNGHEAEKEKEASGSTLISSDKDQFRPDERDDEENNAIDLCSEDLKSNAQLKDAHENETPEDSISTSDVLSREASAPDIGYCVDKGEKPVKRLEEKDEKNCDSSEGVTDVLDEIDKLLESVDMSGVQKMEEKGKSPIDDTDTINVFKQSHVTGVSEDNDATNVSKDGATNVSEDNDATNVSKDDVTKVSNHRNATTVSEDDVTKVSNNGNARNVSKDYAINVSEDIDATNVSKDGATNVSEDNATNDSNSDDTISVSRNVITKDDKRGFIKDEKLTEITKVEADGDGEIVMADQSGEEREILSSTGHSIKEKEAVSGTGQSVEEKEVVLDTGHSVEEKEVVLDTGHSVEEKEVVSDTGHSTQ